ncbi:hypothetical protein FOA43_000469 [Brettanomyces nanus]|uniref:Cleavage/polyadenylation specificity factor A subunit C-terminal domain-containing protein n=1 Tax=Eeniella nana TaxID=13502 RepID=A0A875RX97_EENNA|nr:uncharacterized protein FOA43_000469 [Brettanomyces nanus]QPG73163.1 hypothetical protein FOA43_000469 [Brettanomyces nanus]
MASMSLVLQDEIEHPGVIIASFGFKTEVDGDSTNDHVFMIRPFLVELHRLNLKKQTTSVISKFETKYRIVAANHILSDGQKGEWLLLLNELNQLMVVSPTLIDSNQLKLTVIQTFHIHDYLNRQNNVVDVDKGILTVPSSTPSLEVDPQQRFIIVHSCRCFLLVFELRPSKLDLAERASKNRPPKQVEKNSKAALLNAFKVFEDPYVVTVGSDPIISIRFLSGPSEVDNVNNFWFGMITRDISLRYSLEWYRIYKLRRLSVKKVKKMTPLDSKPTLVYSLSGCNALLIVCGLIQYCYPAPNCEMHCQLDDVKTVGSYAKKRFVTVEASSVAVFVSACNISTTRLLLCSQKGGYYILEVKEKTEKSRTNNSSISERLDPDKMILPSEKNECFDLEKWEVCKCGEEGLRCDYLIGTSAKDSFFGVSALGSFGFSKISSPSQSLKTVTTYQCLPVIFLSSHNSQRMMYAKGNYQGTYLNYGEETLNIPDAAVRKVILMDSTLFGLLFVVLTESHIADDTNDPDSMNIQDRITIYDSNFKKISCYEFDPGRNCVDLLSLEGFKCHLDENDESLTGLDNQMSNSFLAVSTFLDDTNVEKSEILFFIIEDDSADMLRLSTMAILNKELNQILKLNENKCLLLGPHSMFWITITASQKEESICYKIVLASKCLGLPCGYITQVAKLDSDGKELLVADSIEGLYYVKFHDSADKITKVTRILSGVNITTFAMICRDGIAVCDLLGNFYLLLIDDKKQLSIVTQLNLMAGAIGAIDSTLTMRDVRLKDLFSNESAKSSICTVGTNEGAVIGIYGVGRNHNINTLTNYQSYLGVHYSNLIDTDPNKNEDNEKKKWKTMELPSSTKEAKMNLEVHTQMTLDSWYQNESFIEQKFLRLLPGYNFLRIHNAFENTLPEISIVDIRYIKLKTILYGVTKPKDIEDFD